MAKINEVQKLAEDLYVITEAESIHCYLLLGRERALLLDVGYGYEDIHPLIREITSLPLMPVLSHGDPDHGLGISHFSDVWLHPLDYGKLLLNDTSELRKISYDYRCGKMPFIRELLPEKDFTEDRIKHVRPHFLQDGDRIDLGEKELEVIHTPGHSYGHIMLLEKNTGRLFSGDQITGHNIWYFQPGDQQAPFSMAVNSLKKILARRNEIRELYPAHGKMPIDLRYAEDQLDCLENELKDNYRGDREFHSFMGDGYQHFYKTVNLIYSDERLAEYRKAPVIR